MVLTRLTVSLFRLFGRGIQLHTNEILFVYEVIRGRRGCRLLIFGVGHDSFLWSCLNRRGRTVFLEDDTQWLSAIKRAHPRLEIYPVNYSTEISDWRNLLDAPEKLDMDVPPAVRHCSWDVIVVDGPCGEAGYYREAYGEAPPGRMSSIYMASRLVAPGGDVFVHDCEREVEAAYCDKFLGRERLKGEARGRALLRRYHFNSTD